MNKQKLTKKYKKNIKKIKNKKKSGKRKIKILDPNSQLIKILGKGPKLVVDFEQIKPTLKRSNEWNNHITKVNSSRNNKKNIIYVTRQFSNYPYGEILLDKLKDILKTQLDYINNNRIFTISVNPQSNFKKLSLSDIKKKNLLSTEYKKNHYTKYRDLWVCNQNKLNECMDENLAPCYFLHRVASCNNLPVTHTCLQLDNYVVLYLNSLFNKNGENLIYNKDKFYKLFYKNIEEIKKSKSFNKCIESIYRRNAFRNIGGLELKIYKGKNFEFIEKINVTTEMLDKIILGNSKKINRTKRLKNSK